VTKSRVLSFVKCRQHFCFAALVTTFLTTASAQVKTNAPVDHSNVNATFYLQAEAPACESLPTTAMAYSIDSGADVVFSGIQMVESMVSVQTTGSHTVDVKAWNDTGALCDRILSISVGDGVKISAPALGAMVTSPFVLQAEAPTCGGQSTRAMAYEVDRISEPHEDHGLGPNHVQDSSVLNALVDASTGAYLLRVKARGYSGAFCETDIPLIIATTSGLVPPSNASEYDHLENDQTYTGSYAKCGGANEANVNLWQSQPDCATVGTKTGSTRIVSAPTYGEQSSSREFTMTYDTSGGGVRWFDKAIPGQFFATHFQYDAYVNIVDSSKVGELELDINHAITSPTKLLYILAAQCNLTKGLWQVSLREKGWVNTNATCTRFQVASGVWHHFQVQTHHDPDGGTGIYYDAVAIDGNVTPITSCTIASTGVSIPCVSSPSNPGWGALIGPNFQIDGTGPGGSATAYVDDLTVFYW